MLDRMSVLLFLALTIVAVVASLHSWRAREAHGGFRFLAFECLALLIAWNARRWFRAPLSVFQITSWIILTGSAVLAARALFLLRSRGKARARIAEDTQVVVRTGVYRFIRHPLYASLMFSGWGVFLKGRDLVSALLALSATAFWILTARYEERLDVERLGVAYSDYMKGTKRFVPFVF